MNTIPDTAPSFPSPPPASSPDAAVFYAALQARDPRFDGVFFTGVTSTGIYCRPICPARTPRAENCRFFAFAAAAEKDGFRPCLRCRPELAPGAARTEAAGRLAESVALKIEEGALTESNLEELAAELGVSSRHLRRVTEEAFGVSPVELAQTHRLLLAKRLLTDTRLPVGEVALASGFQSLRRFNALFQERYKLTPTALRRETPGEASDGQESTLTCGLAFRPPFEGARLLNFLAQRVAKGVEAVETEDSGGGQVYRRTAAFGPHRGWLAVRLPEGGAAAGKSVLRVEMSASLVPAVSAVLARVKQLFDLSASPEVIAARLGPLADKRPGMRVPGAFDGFEIAVRAILGQQITVRAATTLAGRFSTAFGEAVATPFPALNRFTPTAERVAAATVDDIASLGIISARARAIIALAEAVTSGKLVLQPGAEPMRTVELLQSLPGIGEWTAHYVAMRALSWPDAFPHTDLVLRKASGNITAAALLKQAETWRPWRAYAAVHLWETMSGA